MKFIASISLLLLLIVFWFICVPVAMFKWIPPEFDEFLTRGSPLALFLSIIVLPAVFGLFALVALLLWARMSSWFMPRSDLEAMIKQAPLGGTLGAFEKRVLDRFYRNH
jgi:hypothetical protein